jgi:hypothetical protein
VLVSVGICHSEHTAGLGEWPDERTQQRGTRALSQSINRRTVYASSSRGRTVTGAGHWPRMARAYWVGAQSSPLPEPIRRCDASIYSTVVIHVPWPVYLALQCSGVPFPCPRTAVPMRVADTGARRARRTWGSERRRVKAGRAAGAGTWSAGTCRCAPRAALCSAPQRVRPIA